MTLSGYLKDKFWIFFFIIVAYFVLLSFMIGFKIVVDFQVAFSIIYFLLFLFIFLYDYLRKVFFYRDVRVKLDLLKEKYLICELVKNPNFLEGELFYQMLYEINKSMNENIHDYKEKMNDFKEYVELWIHEVKIPLSALSLYTHNKKTDKVLVGEIHKIDGYLEQILYYIRSENTQNDYIIKEVDLNKVIREVMLKNKDVLLEKQIEIISDVGKLKVLTDYKWLEFMMNQIISNSIKYMKDGLDKKIEIKAYHKEQQIILEILDNGMGIPKSDLGRVFKKTFTGQNGRKVPGSTGMVLYIVDQLCKKLGHKLEIESKEGEYTKVIIVFDENLFYKEVRNME